MVKIFAFLDLEQISEDFEIEHFETASLLKKHAKMSIQVMRLFNKLTCYLLITF